MSHSRSTRGGCRFTSRGLEFAVCEWGRLLLPGAAVVKMNRDRVWASAGLNSGLEAPRTPGLGLLYAPVASLPLPGCLAHTWRHSVNTCGGNKQSKFIQRKFLTSLSLHSLICKTGASALTWDSCYENQGPTADAPNILVHPSRGPMSTPCSPFPGQTPQEAAG